MYQMNKFLSKNYKTGIIILHQKYYINYNYITITIFIIYCLYSYHNRWQLASENLIGTLCVVSGHFVFSFYIFLCLGNMFSIILCTMSNKILPYHTIPCSTVSCHFHSQSYPPTCDVLRGNCSLYITSLM